MHSNWPIRILFLAVAGCLLFSLVVMVYYRSHNRPSVFHATGNLSGSASSVSVPASDKQSELHLQDFHRVEVKEGKKLWEVKARDARYFVDQGVTQVSEAAMTFYRKDTAPIELKAKAAKLLIVGDVLRGVEMEGDIVVSDGSSFEVEAQLASFDVVTHRLHSPSSVTIRGPGYEVRGNGLDFIVGAQKLTLLSDVRSRFEPGTRFPALKASGG